MKNAVIKTGIFFFVWFVLLKCMLVWAALQNRADCTRIAGEMKGTGTFREMPAGVRDVCSVETNGRTIDVQMR